MPLYEYLCQSCGEREEKLESFSAPTEHKCAHCGAPKGMRRQISRNTFTLVGGGWDAQGYDKTPSTPAPKKASASGCKSGGCSCH